MINFVLIVVVFKLTQSNIAVSLLVLSFIIPSILLGLLAGVIIDRMSKKKVLFLTNVFRAILLLVLFFVHDVLFLVYLISFFISLITQFFIPAETPMIPVLVKDESLLQANALFGMGIYASVLIAYALTGPSLLLFGEKYIFILLVLLFTIASFLISLIKVPKVEELREERHFLSFLKEIKNALPFFVKAKKIYSPLFLLSLSQFIILVLAVIGPGYAQNALHIKVEIFPLIFVAPAALGTILGAVLLANYFQSASLEKSATIGVFLSAFSVGLLPFISFTISSTNNIIFVLIGLVAFLLGFSNALVFVPSNTLLQEETSSDVRGKVYGLLNTLSGLVSFFPIVMVGGLADFFGVNKVLIGIAFIIAIIGIRRLL